MPFEDSRRLTGPNLYFAEPGAVLETVGERGEDPRAFDAWAERVERLRRQLGWPPLPLVVRAHRGGAALAFPAPVDQLLCATELNEWAWLGACGAALLHAPGHPASWDEDSAWQTLQRFSQAEACAALRALIDWAAQRSLPVLLDDEQLTIGLGAHGQSWPLTALPTPQRIDGLALAGIPTVLVSGSNGKTTTVRLLAAMLRATGLSTAHSCTDGVFLDDLPLHSGDWSGPAGARAALRHPQAEAAVLETARGGILRRGLALAAADAAIITNISADHFGEYGIDDLDGLAEAKLVLARALRPGGTLVLNADDAQLSAHAGSIRQPLAWFSLDDQHPRLLQHRQRGGVCCGLAQGRLWLSRGDQRHDLGPIEDMPLSVGGSARYNLSNLAGAALLGACLDIPVETIRSVLARFGRQHSDNPGRLQRWTFAGLQILLDYAHNPEGLQGLLEVAQPLRQSGRLLLLLGQAGNRGDSEIAELATVAAQARPDRVVLKDLDGYLRGRQPGEIPALLRTQLLRCGLDDGQLEISPGELQAARQALQWARPGDVLVLPIHALSARSSVCSLLERLAQSGWKAGETLPPN